MNRDPIDELLEGPVTLPDDGFTARVMAALPGPRPANRALDGWLVALGAGVVAAVLAPEAAGLPGALAEGAAALGGALARALAGGGGALPIPLALLATTAALGVAALGAWLLAEPA
jgi:hypothetical protein